MAKDKQKLNDPGPAINYMGTVDTEARALARDAQTMFRQTISSVSSFERRLDEIAIKQVPTLYTAERFLLCWRVYLTGAMYGPKRHALTLRGLRRKIERWERKQRRPRVSGCRRV